MTAISDVLICNLALTYLGEETIENLSEDSVNARLCNVLYEQTRDFVLTDSIWNFAQKRAVLAELSEDPVWTEDQMSVVYQKPTDCLKINFVNIPSAIFKIERDKILSNTSGLKIKYTERITDPTLFFPKFVECFAAKLAADLAYPVTSKRSLVDTMYTLYYEKKLPEARAMDAQQGTPQNIAQDEWLISRLIGSSPLSGQTGWDTWYPVGYC